LKQLVRNRRDKNIFLKTCEEVFRDLETISIPELRIKITKALENDANKKKIQTVR